MLEVSDIIYWDDFLYNWFKILKKKNQISSYLDFFEIVLNDEQIMH